MQVQAGVGGQLSGPLHAMSALASRDVALTLPDQHGHHHGRERNGGHQRDVRASRANGIQRSFERGRGRFTRLNRVDPSIAPRWHRLEIPALPRLVPQPTADLGDDARQGVVGDGGPGPDGVEDLLLGEEMARPLHHQGEQVEGLWFERDGDAGSLEAVGVQVEHEVIPAESGGHVCYKDDGTALAVAPRAAIRKTSDRNLAGLSQRSAVSAVRRR